MKSLDKLAQLTADRAGILANLSNVERAIRGVAAEIVAESGQAGTVEEPKAPRQPRARRASAAPVSPEAPAAAGAPETPPETAPDALAEELLVVCDAMPIGEILSKAEVLQRLIDSGSIGTTPEELEQGKADLTSAMNTLVTVGIVEKSGEGRATKYARVKEVLPNPSGDVPGSRVPM